MTGRTHKRLFAIGITIALLAGTSWGVERTWTDVAGKFSVTAELVKVTGGYPTPFVPQWEILGDKVVLRLQDGKMSTVPLAKLSKEDQQFARESAERAMVVKIGTPPPAVVPFDSDQAKAHQEAWANYLGVPVQITNSLGMKLNLIPPGEFTMGSPKSELGRENGRWDDETQHLVRISKPFYLSACEVQAVHYEKINENPFGVTAQALNKGDTKPVLGVDWNDAVAFCDKLSKREGVEYRLPTEAEWEYACRAGTTTAYSCGDDVSQLGEYAWYYETEFPEVTKGEAVKHYRYEAQRIKARERRGKKQQELRKLRLAEMLKLTLHPVGELKPNPWGLYDMHGNAFEWCQDIYGARLAWAEIRVDPTGPASGSERVLRGGAFDSQPKYVRAAHRGYHLPDLRYHNGGSRLARSGFRLARTIPLSP